MTVTLSDVRDLAGNLIKRPLMWSFIMQTFEANPATVRISAFKLNIPFSAVNTSVATALQESLAMALGVPKSQLANFSPSQAPDGMTYYSFDILPPSGQKSRAETYTAAEIAALLDELDVALHPFLTENVDTDHQVGSSKEYLSHVCSTAKRYRTPQQTVRMSFVISCIYSCSPILVNPRQ